MPTKKNVELPDIGDFDSVDVIEVLVKVGDVVNENDSLITLETDKATMEIPAPFSGKVASLAVKIGDKIATGELILTLESDSDQAEDTSNEAAAPSNSETIESSNIEIEAPKIETTKEEITLTTDSTSHASPSIRKLARELGVSLSKIKGTGKKGRILEDDLKSFVKQIVIHGDTGNEVEVVPLSKIKNSLESAF